MWQSIGREHQSHRKATAFTIVALGFVVLISLLTAFYMTGVLRVGNLEDRLQKLSLEFMCAHEESCNIDTFTKECKCPPGLRLKKPSDLSVHCSRKKDFLQWFNSVINKELTIERRQLKRDVSESEYRNLEITKDAILDPNRIIIHWFPRVVSTVTDNSTWTPILNYEHSSSTYTVSPGPEGSHSNGALVIPESGVYYVYAKVTFACESADLKNKRVEIQVAMTSPVEESPFILIQNMEDGTCSIKGDLFTLNVNGVFRLEKGNQITVRHKASKNVGISSGPNSAFKSALGLFRVGLV